MAWLIVETKRLSVKTTELRQLYMELLSNKSGICDPPHLLPSLNKDSPPPPSVLILYMNCIQTDNF